MPDDWDGHPLRKDDAAGARAGHVQGRPEPAMTTTIRDTRRRRRRGAPRAPDRRGRAGAAAASRTREVVLTGGGMWPEDELDDTMIINMGPQHPSTHGVLRLMMELDGEDVLRVKPVIGYLHTGMEKTGEELTYVQGAHQRHAHGLRVAARRTSSCTRMAVERLLDIEVPPRATWIRMMLVELNRMSSHLLFQATNGMDIGAVSMMLYGWREREEVLRLPRVRSPACG